MKRRIFFFILLSFLFLTSCRKKNASSPQSSLSSQSLSSAASSSSDFSYLDIVKIKKGKNLEIDSPEIFLQLYILFNHDQKIWLKEVAMKTNSIQEPEKYLEEKRNEFYASFGLKESDFNRYSSQHYDEINRFLKEHADYQKAVELSEK